MINLEVKTKLSTSEVCNRLKSFFGEGGLGLKITEETQSCLSFEGGGGYVITTVCKEGKQTQINLKSMEWEIQVKNFAASLS
jgi:hypothetical protein